MHRVHSLIRTRMTTTTSVPGSWWRGAQSGLLVLQPLVCQELSQQGSDWSNGQLVLQHKVQKETNKLQTTETWNSSFLRTSFRYCSSIYIYIWHGASSYVFNCSASSDLFKKTLHTMLRFVKFKPFVNPVVSVNILYAHHTVSLTFLTDSTKEMMQQNI